jgi:hypothetical protein
VERNRELNIEAGRLYRIKGASKYFLRKYGTPNPIIKMIHPIDLEKEGYNPPGFLFLGRAYAEGIPTNPAWYGHVVPDDRGEIVNQNELEEVPRA